MHKKFKVITHQGEEIYIFQEITPSNLMIGQTEDYSVDNTKGKKTFINLNVKDTSFKIEWIT